VRQLRENGTTTRVKIVNESVESRRRLLVLLFFISRRRRIVSDGFDIRDLAARSVTYMIPRRLFSCSRHNVFMLSAVSLEMLAGAETDRENQEISGGG